MKHVKTNERETEKGDRRQGSAGERVVLPVGAEVMSEGVRYRVWAPGKKWVEVEIRRGAAGVERKRMQKEEGGYFRVVDAAGGAGDRYRLLYDGSGPFPDPASRFQPDGVHGESMVINPGSYEWKDGGWRRPRWRDAVIYEAHVGTFSEEGTFRGAMGKLEYLKDLGVTALQIMPVADFPGRWNWGYDGVALFAPARCYGTPNDLRALVDAAHGHGLGVVLDVVYNHFGPDGNYTGAASPFYLNAKHHTPWGAAVNYDGEQHAAVREFVLANARYWMDEFHVDGLRLDATHAICDDTTPHLLAEIAELVHARGGWVVGEDERNEARLITPAPAGYGLDAVYADDFCHAVQVAVGDRSYAEDFTGSAAELADTLAHGWHYRGKRSARSGRARGTEGRHLAPASFYLCISNHDQAGNRALGERIHHLASPEAARAASALLLLAPGVPMIFMGDEWAASTPFQYFTDHHDELGRQVSEGRRREFAQFPEFREPRGQERIPDPQAEATFRRSKLNWGERAEAPHRGMLELHRACLRLRAAEAAFRPGTREQYRVEEAGAAALRFYGETAEWLVLVDLAGGHAVTLTERESTRAPAGRRWAGVLRTNDREFGGEAERPPEALETIPFPQAELMLFRAIP